MADGGGYNLFLNRRIQVDLQFDGDPVHLSLSEVKERVLRAFGGKQGWDSSEDCDTLVEAVNGANSVGEVARTVTEAYFMTFQ